MDFSSAAHELYGVTPEEFVATRKRLVEQARRAGDAALAKRVGALRRPTLPAWAVNLLSRAAGEELGWLLDVGEQMREAWASGGPIGGLEQRRGELVTLLVRTAGRLAREAGHPLRDDAVREVEDTLQAATVDTDVAEEVREGRLTRPRSHAGFVPAGFALAPPRPRPPQPAKARGKAENRPESQAAERQRAGQAARDRARSAQEEHARKAAARAEQAERALAEHDAEVVAAKEHLAEAAADVRRLRRELDRAVEREEAARRRLDRAEEARSHAAQAAARARGAADEAARPR
ncbi:hypothetical protein ABZ801_38900 [Actinomadura sp. NPDC047616]|uniref:hypothetical protein n=1 Tax=Actinomadura sp. NPDC047616 TaxID=3155914 RepID=UPI0033E22BC8